ncbi:YcaO-like family protein [Clostridiaceae bacterium M8S5]|nr:YcaO-like family protein [Clostridiaceae bacterium M8S5]
MKINQENHYKDVLPIKTINLLKNILKEMAIDIEERWLPVSTVGTYSLRINVKGSLVGTNGKGVSKEYALASAYAEFFERYQNKVLLDNNYCNFDKFGYYSVKDEKYMTAKEIISSNNSLINLILSSLSIDNVSDEDKIKKFEELFNLGKLKNGKYLVYPFYNTTKKRIEYLPDNLIKPYYGTNGMCAGNSSYEALVQGFSEIFERHINRKVIEENLSLPDVPEEHIIKYPQVYEMYKTMNELENYKFYIKDCSMNNAFPVVALIIIEKNTGKYGVHFGAHPDFGIALERSFTEACQGQDILEFAKNSTLDFTNRRVNTNSNYYNIFGVAKGQYPYQFLSRKSDVEFTPFEDVSEKNNKELLYRILNSLEIAGYDIYIRDVSILGFPSYHIIVPHLSELTKFTEIDIKFTNTFKYIQKFLSNPSKISLDNITYIIGTIHYYYKYVAFNCMQKIYTRHDDFKYPYEEINCDIVYFLSMCYILQENYKKGGEYIGLMLYSDKLDNQQKSLLNATQKYFEGRAVELSHEETISYLESFYDNDICKSINEMYINPQNVIRLQYPDDNKKEVALHNVLDKLNKREIIANINQSNLESILQLKETIV